MLGATFTDLAKQPEILLPKGFASSLVGVDYSDDEINKVLSDIGAVTAKDPLGLKVTPPSWRPDLVDKTDLVEEIARILGYDRIPTRLPIAPPGRGLSRGQQFRSGALDALATAGYVEVLSYPFVSAEQNGWFQDSKQAVTLANPIQEEAAQLRLSLIPGLIETAKRNLSRGFTDLALVEQGSVFISVKQTKVAFPDTSSRPSDADIKALNASIPLQPKHLAGIFLGNRSDAQPGQKPVRFGVQDALYAAKLVGQAIGVSFDLKQAEPTGYHPGRSAELLVGNRVVGFVGEIAPAITKQADLPRTVGVFEIDLDALLEATPESVVAKMTAGGKQSDFAKAGYNLLTGWSYKSQWWVTHNNHGAFNARGIHGQTIYVDPKAQMVIVRFASHPKAANANFDDISLPAYQAIAERLMAKK
jgi:phenylalanyl-tRNA synthetase beta chain